MITSSSTQPLFPHSRVCIIVDFTSTWVSLRKNCLCYVIHWHLLRNNIGLRSAGSSISVVSFTGDVVILCSGLKCPPCATDLTVCSTFIRGFRLLSCRVCAFCVSDFRKKGFELWKFVRVLQHNWWVPKPWHLIWSLFERSRNENEYEATHRRTKHRTSTAIIISIHVIIIVEMQNPIRISRAGPWHAHFSAKSSSLRSHFDLGHKAGSQKNVWTSFESFRNRLWNSIVAVESHTWRDSIGLVREKA